MSPLLVPPPLTGRFLVPRTSFAVELAVVAVLALGASAIIRRRT